MADWLSSMQQTYEYYTVDQKTWKDKDLIANVKTSSITRDNDTDTLGSATIDITESVGESYVRIYLVTIQNGVREKHALATVLVQTPSSEFDGKIRIVSMDAYTPLLELKDKKPPIGYYIPKGENILDIACRLLRELISAPIVATKSDDVLQQDFVADTNDTWFSFLTDLLANTIYSFALDEMGRIMFAPRQDTAALQPVYTFNDDNSSILYPEITLEHDLYDVPNVVEVVYSGDSCYYSKIVNDDPNSPTSTVRRGREIVHRVTDPEIVGDPTQRKIDAYAEQLLRDLSSVEYSISYTHGYCGTRLNDCVRLNYTKAGLHNVKAKIVRQAIKCEPGCPVTEKAVFTETLWR